MRGRGGGTVNAERGSHNARWGRPCRADPTVKRVDLEVHVSATGHRRCRGLFRLVGNDSFGGEEQTRD